MKSTILISALAAATHAYDLDMSPPHPDYIFANPTVETADHRIPTAHESAVMGRRILALTKLGHLATVFPSSSSSSTRDHDDETEAQDWRRPAGLEGAPHRHDGLRRRLRVRRQPHHPRHQHRHDLPEHPRRLQPLRLPGSGGPSSPRALPAPLPRTMYDDGEKCQFRDDEHTRGLPRDTVPYSAANLPRLSLIGYLEKIDEASDPLVAARLAACFVRTHPDAKYWLPGNRIHASEWARLVVTSVYWVGGFGDRAYIGWLPVDDWHSITRDEWQAIELPGEREGWREWSVPGDEEKQFAVDL
ncbi:conserved hypothetical protein [Verticillium alfalfae VaMs.102]|uniref:CREG-like beta-barrel domain-containing protein n=1 Tax=Verticillium alfalfae (strain VaMs.102 / ATCC MYA-4576 / FGSC 10136) TaxID=526221 RepID=C9SBF2_VERA1|nr:conserved hypothetical protein [Verticillium alfalfae VaMs.102]EEY15686.1 conserved hypothetical protein [Verticillium alfalfae VaMs.102]